MTLRERSLPPLQPLSCDLLLSHIIFHTLACDLLQYHSLLATPLNMIIHFTIFLTPSTAFTYPLLAKLSEKRTNNNKIEAMKKPSVCVAAIVIILCCVPVFTSARHIRRLRTNHSQHHGSQPSTREGMVAETNSYWERRPMLKRKGADTLQIAGSSLPDCSHACGSCTPCRLVMVSFVCASLEEAETCPMAYKCMCKNKSYPVP